jgi:hypothetical protein
VCAGFHTWRCRRLHLGQEAELLTLTSSLHQVGVAMSTVMSSVGLQPAPRLNTVRSPVKTVANDSLLVGRLVDRRGRYAESILLLLTL